MRTNTNTRMHAHKNTHEHAYAHQHAQTCTCTHTRTRTHTHTRLQVAHKARGGAERRAADEDVALEPRAQAVRAAHLGAREPADHKYDDVLALGKKEG